MTKNKFFCIAGDESFESGLDVFINTFSVQPNINTHSHKFIEVGYVISGTILHRNNDCENILSKGNFFLINNNDIHELIQLSDDPPIIYNIIFKAKFIDHILYDCKDFCQIANHYLINTQIPIDREKLSRFLFYDKNGEILDIFKKINSEYAEKKNGFYEILRTLVIELIIQILRIFNEDSVKFSDLQNKDKQINCVISHLMNNYHKQISLDEMAAVAFMSPEYLCRKFKTETNTTPTKFLQKIRIKEACRLLLQPNSKVAEVAEEVGYKDLKYFKYLFKSFCGKSPAEYRSEFTAKSQQVDKGNYDNW